MRPVLVLAIVMAGPALSACRQRCDGNLECGTGSYCSGQHRCEIDCFVNDDCRMPIECRANPDNCAPKGLYCSQHGKCVGPVGERPDPETYVPGFEKPTDGWTTPVGAGLTFVMNAIQVGEQGVGFDLDGKGGIDNVLHAIGPQVNNSITQGIRSGDVLLLVEIAGLDLPYTGNDDSVTLKLYGGVDADNPINNANNLAVPPGQEGPCCQFKVDSRWLTVENDTVQATVRAPAFVKNGRLYAPTNFPHYSFDVQFLLTVGLPPFKTIVISSSQLQVDLDSDLGQLRRGVLGGGLTANSLAAIDNPFCGTRGPTCPSGNPASTLLDLVSYLAGPAPDVDVDADGRECALDTTGDQIIDLCCDGAGASVCSASDRVCADSQIPDDPGDPGSCTRSARLTDGYSVAFTFTAVPAQIVGTGTRR